MDRGEDRLAKRRRRPSRDSVPREERYFVPTIALKAALAAAPKIDYARFRADIDAYVDQGPASRFWPKA